MSILSRNQHVMTAALFAAIAALACARSEQTTATTAVAAPTQVVRSAALPDLRWVSGTVRSSNVSPLAAKVMGNVTRVLVSEGDFVRAGQPLLEIDSRDLRARSAQAEAQAGEVEQAIAAAQANANVMASTFNRFAALRERGSVSPQEFDEISAKNKAAQAQLQQALARRAQVRAAVSEADTFVGYSVIRAPFDGVVTARMIDPGAQAAPGMPLLTIEDSSSYRVESNVDEALASQVHAGDDVVIEGTHAKVAAITPSFDPMTRSALVKINLPKDAKLRSGSFVRVGFHAGTRKAIAIPANAITRRGELTSVYVVDDNGTARLRLVTLGEERDGNIEVLSGLDDGERIVTQISAAVRDGVRVS